MPWRGPSYEGEFPTLGYLVADWIEARCVVPDGDYTGTPYRLTDEMLRFLLFHYRLKEGADQARPASAFVYRRSQLVRPQKWGKGPFSAAIILAEAAADGPVLFDGWDANGDPVGRAWPTPFVQVTAASEEQARNVWSALLPMVQLSDLAADIPDTGETRINLPGGGRIEPTTASGRSRLGQRITFALQDETHSWLKTNGGHVLADTQKRNTAGVGGRVIETTNAWNPAEESTAQLTDAAPDDVYKDRTVPPKGSFKNARERRKILKTAYGDSWWIDLDRIDAECVELIDRGEIAQAERFFGNRIVATADAWIASDVWSRCEAPGETIADGELVTLGFDGARFDDSTAIVACRVSDGLVQLVGVWEKPEETAAADGWEVDTAAVDAAVAECFRRWQVAFFYCDPPYWQDSVGAWSSEFGDKIVREWWTNRERAMVAALERFSTSVHLGELKHDGNHVLTRHVLNARRRNTRAGVGIRKERPGSPNKIDAAVAAVLAFEARGDAIAAGRNRPRRRGGGGE